MNNAKLFAAKTIGFNGEIGANAHLACKKFYPESESISFSSFTDVFAAVEEGKIDIGMIPLENSYAGRVAEIHNLFQNMNVFIVGEHFFRVTHVLAALPDSDISEIKDVYSHPQALMQCSKNLRIIGVSTHESSTTSEAAKFISKSSDKSKAAICSRIAAEANGLKILQEEFEDDKNNTTIFVVISKNGIDPEPSDGMVVTTVLFTIRNLPGSLFKSLGGFATNGVNMLKLESYIPGGVSNQAQFFISIEGHPNQENVRNALEELEFFSKKVKLIGIYYADKDRLNKNL